jgi:hypothetical protein
VKRRYICTARGVQEVQGGHTYTADLAPLNDPRERRSESATADGGHPQAPAPGMLPSLPTPPGPKGVGTCGEWPNSVSSGVKGCHDRRYVLDVCRGGSARGCSGLTCLADFHHRRIYYLSSTKGQTRFSRRHSAPGVNPIENHMVCQKPGLLFGISTSAGRCSSGFVPI